MTPDNKRLATAFHESFAFSRPQASQLLRAIDEAPNSLDLSSKKQRITYLREKTHLGTNQVKSMPGYAYGAGLLDSAYRLTNFARAAIKNDVLLEMASTQWLIHYHLSAPHGPGPVFWHELVSRKFRSGDEFSPTDIKGEISEIIQQEFGKELSEETIDRTKTVFVSTYINQDGLGPLNILASLDQSRYLVLDPDPPSVWVFGLALLDFWRARYGNDRLTINLDDLYGAGGLGDIFLMGGGRINQYLRRLQEEGVVEVFRVAPPYQLVLTQRDPQPLLERIYAHDAG